MKHVNPFHVAIIVCGSIFLGSVVLPLSLHTISMHQLQTALFSAVRFAAEKDPKLLAALPVSSWNEEDRIMLPSVERLGWARFEMKIPRDASTVIATIDLRRTFAPLFLGAGGWLRVLLGVAVSAALSYWGIRSLSRLPGNTEATQFADVYHQPNSTPEEHPILKSAIDQLSFPAIIFNRYHQVVHWNAAACSESTQLEWYSGIHLLDVAEKLSWGTVLLEKVDEVVASQGADWAHLLVTRMGDQLCVTAG